MRVAFLYNESSEDPAGIAEDSVPSRSPLVLALRRAGHTVTPVACTLDLSAVRRELERERPEVAFNRVESLGGSDALAAAVPLLLDVMRLPYTGCTTESLLATANKVAVKEQLVKAGLPTPEWVTVGGDCGMRNVDCGLNGSNSNSQSANRNPKFILKSILEHASFAMDDASIVAASDVDHVVERIRDCESHWQRPYFAEQFIDGREFNLAVLGRGPTVLPPAEIDFSAFPAGKPRIVGRGAKFDAESFEYENTPRQYDFPAADGLLVRQLSELAAACWQLFGLTGFARVDFRVDSDNQPWILEINSNPCLAPDSGFAAAAAEAGIAYDDLVERILVDAVERDPRKFIQPVSRTMSTLSPARESAAVCQLRDAVCDADRDAVRSLVARTGFFRSDEIEIAVELVEERLASGLASGYEFLFAESAGKVVGYACYGPIACTIGSYDLYWIAVDPRFQRHGLGRRIIADVESRVAAADGRRIYIDTSGQAKYTPTRAFYERSGYEIAAQLADFYAPGDDRVIYVRKLTGRP